MNAVLERQDYALPRTVLPVARRFNHRWEGAQGTYDVPSLSLRDCEARSEGIRTFVDLNIV